MIFFVVYNYETQDKLVIYTDSASKSSLKQIISLLIKSIVIFNARFLSSLPMHEVLPFLKYCVACPYTLLMGWQ